MHKMLQPSGQPEVELEEVLEVELVVEEIQPGILQLKVEVF